MRLTAGDRFPCVFCLAEFKLRETPGVEFWYACLDCAIKKFYETFDPTFSNLKIRENKLAERHRRLIKRGVTPEQTEELLQEMAIMKRKHVDYRKSRQELIHGLELLKQGVSS